MNDRLSAAPRRLCRAAALACVGFTCLALPAVAGDVATPSPPLPRVKLDPGSLPRPQAVRSGPASRAAAVPEPAAGSRPEPRATILRTGLEAPSPALPRLPSPRLAGLPGGLPACRDGGPTCRDGACGARCAPPAAACEGGCPLPIFLPCEPLPPVVGPYLVCDGGDHGAPAKAVGEAGLGNLTAGDTVARYRPADDQLDSTAVRLAVSNCACVYAPRFGSVRELVRPLEDAVPQGPRGLALDQRAGQAIRRQPVWGSVQQLQPEAARKALPGVAVEDRVGPLAVDQGDPAREADAHVQPALRVADEQPDGARRAERPLVKVGFDVPVAWTCVKAANVLVEGRTPQVVAADRGTATLRFESPGRAELTLCKRAGTDTARSGEEIDFMIYLLNSGDRPLADVVLVDALPSRLELVPDSPASSLPAATSTEVADDGGVVVKWRIETVLEPGQGGFVRFRTRVR